MKIAVVREPRTETRVALVPDAVAKLVKAGHVVIVESGAGDRADFDDAEYTEAGAKSRASPGSGRPTSSSRSTRSRAIAWACCARGAATISFLPTGQRLDVVAAMRHANITSFALELVPRISRAQSMDALSSQALVAGYRGAVVAAGLMRRFFPQNMTAAGTIQPAQVVVLGAGVAGLQAIATSRRLGAVVKAYDVREAAAEEIRSMGAKAIELDLETLEGSGGYAREMTEDRAAKQRELLTPFIADADVLITTAAVPGRQAPMLVTRAMVEEMKPGSVVVDLAAESGGNVEGSAPGEVVQIGHANVWGGQNVAGQMPGPASSLLAQNIVNLLLLAADEDGAWAPDFEDEIIAGACVTHQGEVKHEPSRSALDGKKADLEAESPQQEAGREEEAEESQQEEEGADS